MGVKEMLDKAKDILGYDILQICLEGPESKLEETKYCQPAMFIGGLAGLEKLREEKPDRVDRAAIMAGLSLGEYTALCAAGVMSFEDGLKLVKLRGEAMQEAAQTGKQLMLSVAGLEKPKLDPLVKECAKMGADEVCQISNSLFPGGYSIGGTEKAINALKDKCEGGGIAGEDLEDRRCLPHLSHETCSGQAHGSNRGDDPQDEEPHAHCVDERHCRASAAWLFCGRHDCQHEDTAHKHCPVGDLRSGDYQRGHHRVLRVRTHEADEGHDEAHRREDVEEHDQH